jgi:serine/threonine protein kinase
MIMDSLDRPRGFLQSVTNREAQAGPTSSASARRGERFPSGLRVRGRYRVIDELGAGVFGTVCVGEDESTGHRVAIRFFPRNVATTPQAAQAVLRVGRSIMAASTSHPAIARVLEFGELDAGPPFAVTEFVEGRRLSELMSGRAPVELGAALRIALELGGAIETLHNMGFVHGAINPRNVVVLEDGRVKLLDVELAGLRDAREIQAEYLSPEQIENGPTTEKTDIYAFGVLLYELLGGAPPFQGPTRDAIFVKHLKDVPAPIHRRRDGVPASVARAVTLALSKQAEARPLMGDVLNLLWTGAHGPAPRRTRAVVIGGGVGLAALAVAAVVWGVLVLRPPYGSSPPVARPAIETAPVAPAPPAVETRRPLAPVVATPPASATPVERAAPATRAPSPAAPIESRSAPTVRTPPSPVIPPARVAPPPAPITAAPSPAVRATPPAVTPPAAIAAPPVPAPSSVAAPASPVPPAPQALAPASAPVAPRVERREPSQAQPAPAPQPASASDRDDATAAIDWLLKSRGQ